MKKLLLLILLITSLFSNEELTENDKIAKDIMKIIDTAVLMDNKLINRRSAEINIVLLTYPALINKINSINGEMTIQCIFYTEDKQRNDIILHDKFEYIYDPTSTRVNRVSPKMLPSYFRVLCRPFLRYER